MKRIRYLIQFICIISLFSIFRLLGLKYSSILSGNIFRIFGPMFRSNKIVFSNLQIAYPNINKDQQKIILGKMWINYGRMLAEYMFIKNFRTDEKYKIKISIENQNIIENIKKENDRVIFISGHFNNFELMAMQIEKLGVNLAALYRPLNNFFLNPIMENIRKKYICKKQIKKGISGTKELLRHFKNGTSIALMIDQRVSQGIKVNFFGNDALTTTIPAQFVKKFDAKIVPVYIERNKDDSFQFIVSKSIKFDKDEDVQSITLKLNKVLEKMISLNPDQWIWTHNRWK